MSDEPRLLYLHHDWNYDQHGIMRCKRCHQSEHALRFKGQLLDCYEGVRPPSAAGRQPANPTGKAVSESPGQVALTAGAHPALEAVALGLVAAILIVIERGF